MQVVLVMFRPDGSRRSFSLARDLTIIGRGEDCDLRIPLGEVSRKHARLAKDGDSLHLEDLGSSNGTYVNGERIQEAMLNGGDLLDVGPLSFVVQVNGFPADDDITPPVESPADVDHPADVHAPLTEDSVQADAQDVIELEKTSPEPATADDTPVQEIDLEELAEERHAPPPAPPLPPSAAAAPPPPPPPPPLPPGVKKFEPVPLEVPPEVDLDILNPQELEPVETPPAPPVAAGESARAIILSSSGRLPDIREILAAIKAHLRGQSLPKTAQWKSGNLTVQAGPYTLLVSLKSTAYPWADLEGPASTSWWWPEATEKLQPLQHHFVVEVTGGDLDAIDRRLLLTHLARAVVATTDAVGVLWAEGSLVHEASKFLEQSASVSGETPPASLWVDVRIEQNEDNTYRCFTSGMASLGFLEIEVPQTTLEPGELYTFISDTAQSILSSRVQFQDGEHLARSEDHQFVTHHTPSIYDRGTVLSLTLA